MSEAVRLMQTPYDAMVARLRESIGPTVEDRSAPMQEEDPEAEQLASVLRMLARRACDEEA
jgi:hypothetical protein